MGVDNTKVTTGPYVSHMYVIIYWQMAVRQLVKVHIAQQMQMVILNMIPRRECKVPEETYDNAFEGNSLLIT